MGSYEANTSLLAGPFSGGQEMNLESVKRRHQQFHDQLAGAMLIGLPSACDVCWLIKKLESR